MAKNRSIPFGYRMENGEITPHPDEVLAVLQIFSDYLAGMSLREIAAKMTVPYAEGTLWNKHQVKRILENEKYCGKQGFPQLISPETYAAVQEKKAMKHTLKCDAPDDYAALKKLAYCHECGQKMSRSQQGLWDCRSSGCSRLLFRLTDQMLAGAVLHVLNTAIANPVLLDTNVQLSYSPTPEIIRQQNEINRMLDGQSIDFDAVKSEIYRLAEMKYACISDENVQHTTEKLKKYLQAKTPQNSLDPELLKTCIAKIEVCHDSKIRVIFTNGVTIETHTERSQNP